MRTLLVSACTMLSLSALAQNSQQMKPADTEVWEPVPKVIVSGTATCSAPDDAIILFDGKSLQQWENEKGGTPQWQVKNGALTVVKGAGMIKTKQQFEDFQLHIEWRTPAVVDGEGQGRGNSGVFLQEYYELQVLDSYNNRTYSNGQAGSFYKQKIPLVNASKKPGEWQTYDVIWTAPRFHADGSLQSPARATVLQNGVLVQNNVTLEGQTQYIGKPFYEKHGPKSIALQDHGNPVSYRNIWIRTL
ncbi:3-keto-disaccharide hydrolase [Chitinophaga nivalis]|uniref:DUF1080 domain-containing protein n=1 Tax=Chitinophaga nivalis TaxID=2991709 RepID=A0ABT3INN0_9BACT|nr:DUF1080 domain-containing protein [Chitinophaga nivalis]MCW3464728.1 DUF1080 domain-containing protein [Chitinophaga nivalis]MCW3485581.1 DUF1080 domain-containing protein [Chitinophaga nivalis]